MKMLFCILFIIGCTNPGFSPSVQPGNAIVDNTPVAFIVLGDWGRVGNAQQRDVAAQMGRTAKEENVDFVISTGDNLYPKGVNSEYDSLWKYAFEDVYTDSSLQRDWYPVLGNHDYGSNPEAEVAYSRRSNRWKMPARYYSRKIALNAGSNHEVLIVFIDTTPLVKEYYTGSSYNIDGQDTTAQKQWIEKVLSDPSPNIKWRLVIGHHPMYTGGSRTEAQETRDIRGSLQPLFEKFKVDAYIAGHEHSLQHILGSDGGVNHFISGAASEKTPTAMLHNSKFAASEYGFMLFSVQPEKIIVKVVSSGGSVLYETELIK